MKGLVELKVIERPATLDIASGKNKEIYGKILATLDVMGATKCIELAPAEITGSSCYSKVTNLRAGLNRTIKVLKKDYRPCVAYDKNKDMIYVWSRIIVK